MVIETQEKFQQFVQELDTHDVIIIPILCDQKRHALNNTLSFLFVKILDEPRYYIIPFNHNDCLGFDISLLIQLNTQCKKYVFDKKQLLNIFPFCNVIDINLMYYLTTNLSLDFASLYEMPKSHILIQKEYDILKDLNSALPILKYHEALIKLSNKLEMLIQENMQVEKEPYFDFLNNSTILCLQKIEKEGLCVDPVLALEKFPQLKLHMNKQNRIFTEYNIYTATGRPANRFGNVNFAALNKDNGERAIIKSRFENGKIIMFDYDAYHLVLMAKLVGYEFPSDINIHEYLGRQYFGKDMLTEEEYSESKAVSFQVLYGGIDESVAEVMPFFREVSKFIDNLWQTSQEKGYTESIISKRKIHTKDFNKNKLFNYVLQNYETERNIGVMQNIHEKLKFADTKLILYAYDGFVFDTNMEEESLLMSELRVIVEEGGFKTKKYIGNNFFELEKIE